MEKTRTRMGEEKEEDDEEDEEAEETLFVWRNEDSVVVRGEQRNSFVETCEFVSH